jgi:hypothetical protein
MGSFLFFKYIRIFFAFNKIIKIITIIWDDKEVEKKKRKRKRKKKKRKACGERSTIRLNGKTSFFSRATSACG